MAERMQKGKCADTLPLSFVCLDTETTGLSPKNDRIIELSAIKYVNGIQTDSFDRLIRIPYKLSPFIVRLTGITDNMLRQQGLDEQRVLSDFLQFTKGQTVVGHNIRFDIGFLCQRCQSVLGLKFDNAFVDTLSLSRTHNKGLKHHSLDDLATLYHIPPRTLHRALGDVQMTAAVYFCLRNQILRQFDPLPFVEDFE